MYCFVYGTLRKGYGNHVLLQGCEYIGTIIAELPFEMISLGAFPALVPTENGEKKQIVGEVYEISRENLSDLDHLEGYPNFYNRMQFKLQDYGIDGEAWFYFINDRRTGFKNTEVVVSGDWRSAAMGRPDFPEKLTLGARNKGISA